MIKAHMLRSKQCFLVKGKTKDPIRIDFEPGAIPYAHSPSYWFTLPMQEKLKK